MPQRLEPLGDNLYTSASCLFDPHCVRGIVETGWSRKRSIYPEDIAATIYSALGTDYSKKLTNTPSGRAFEYLEASPALLS